MSKDLPPSRTAEQFVVRFPDGMRDKIADAAKANSRSMNAEIVARLQSSLESNDSSLAPVLARLERSLSDAELAYQAMAGMTSLLAKLYLLASDRMPDDSPMKVHRETPSNMLEILNWCESVGANNPEERVRLYSRKEATDALAELQSLLLKQKS